MAAYRRVYDSRHLQADCQEPGSAPEPYAQQSSTGYLYLFYAIADQVYRFPLTFRLAENYPVDLYFLMDVSRTMRSYKDNLVALSDRLGQFPPFITRKHAALDRGSRSDRPLYRGC